MSGCATNPTGGDRRQAQDQGELLAGKSSLHRLEWGLQGKATDDRYRRIAVDSEAVDRFFVELSVDGHEHPPEQIALDLDATDDPLRGAQPCQPAADFTRQPPATPALHAQRRPTTTTKTTQSELSQELVRVPG
jgi:hypothetical protein